MTQDRKAAKRSRRRFIGLMALWAVLVCYPNPLVIARNLWHYASFPVDAGIARAFEGRLPRKPAEIEAFVLDFVRYRYDWQLYGVPWYVPSPREAIRDRAGDCEARAFVLASLLKAKGIPYQIQASPAHMWVSYPGKAANRLENDREAYVRKVDGRWSLRLPNLAEWKFYLASQREMWWDTMPAARKGLLVAGWGLLILWRLRRHRKGVESE
ncbi:MAG: transglutaminase domain-containing protein [Armatimonadetes bacterium]|nr:transglutaminase domain-containing protein [Armatimonadota bacterium]